MTWLSDKIRGLKAQADEIGVTLLAEQAEKVDRECIWPETAMHRLGEAGLLGLHVPVRLGGHEQGLLAMVNVCEALGKCCSSTAMCFGMHSVATAVIAAKATPDQEERYLKPIAEGKHITTLALSESGTGVHFYFPRTSMTPDHSRYMVNGQKQFVTNGGHADSYVVSTSSGEQAGPGEFSCLIVDRGTDGMNWLEEWTGMGMRGNSSRGLKLANAPISEKNLLGKEGDQIWYVFEVVAPYFLTAMAGTYLGISQAALDVTLNHVRGRQYDHSGESLAESPVVQHRVANMWTTLEKTRQLVYSACYRADIGDSEALAGILASKADAGDTAVAITNEAMTLCGGRAYRDNAVLSRLLRDARAAHVMAPTTDLLKQWLGKTLLGLSIL